MVTTYDVNGRLVGPDESCFVIAEAGVNHNGDLHRAFELVDAAVDAGADAVKFQTFNAKQLVTEDAPKATYQQGRTNASETQIQMLSRLELSESDHQALVTHCQTRGIAFMSTPFDHPSVDLLAWLGVPVYKIPSGEITNLPLLEHVAGQGKPMIISTGMCTLGEVEAAVHAVEQAGNREIVLLHCVSNYPADPADVNLRAMTTLNAAFGYPIGYSDHTLGISVGVASVAMGACVLEKHFTLDRTLPGPDHVASLEPAELKDLIDAVRTVELAKGGGRKTPAASEGDTARVARKSLVAACPIPAGTRLTNDVIAIRRPGTGLPPAMKAHLLDRTATSDIPEGALIRLENVA